MIGAISMAVLAGALIGLSRQVNGRLSLAQGALGASFWNHLVGALALALSALGLVLTGAGPNFGSLAEAPAFAWFGGTLGVLFVAAGSWLVARIGATATALLVIAGQMISGALIDTLRHGTEGAPIRALGVVVILAGVALASKR
ncbi:MAG TPA: DMT family transporter [Rubellimicrobium sp.]|jgi:transporter family-2 protein|nr:DMT family transporter [Rubellimicrobium sp.]